MNKIEKYVCQICSTSLVFGKCMISSSCFAKEVHNIEEGADSDCGVEYTIWQAILNGPLISAMKENKHNKICETSSQVLERLWMKNILINYLIEKFKLESGSEANILPFYNKNCLCNQLLKNISDIW